LSPPFLVGVAGGTASGKTTVAQRVVELLGPSAQLLTHDRYYLDAPEGAALGTVNFDHPDSLDNARLARDLDQFMEGIPSNVPRYDFVRRARDQAEDLLHASAVLVVEGILVLSNAQLREKFDLKVFVHAPADVRLIRRITRDQAERGRELADIVAQYLSTVRPMHEQFVEPSRAFADLELDGTHPQEALAATLLGAINRTRGAP
jgi:uridine kinase